MFNGYTNKAWGSEATIKHFKLCFPIDPVLSAVEEQHIVMETGISMVLLDSVMQTRSSLMEVFNQLHCMNYVTVNKLHCVFLFGIFFLF